MSQPGPSQNSAESISVTAPTAHGTYYYGACADPVSNESSTVNNCSSAVEVEVAEPNQAPRPEGTIPDRTLSLDDEISVNPEPYFTDPDGDDLVYTARSNNTAVATVKVSGSDVRMKGHAEGNATITVTATDPGGLTATQTSGSRSRTSPTGPRSWPTRCPISSTPTRGSAGDSSPFQASSRIPTAMS